MTTITSVSPNLASWTPPAALARPAALTGLDRVTLSAAPPAASDVERKKKLYRSVAWTGFGVEMVGGALTLAGNGALGLPLFAVGAAAIVYGEYKKNHG